MISKRLLEKLYLKDRHSSTETAKILRCSEHRINYWLIKHKIPKRSISEAVYAKHNPNGDPFKVKEIKTLEDAKLFGLGLGLYWGEGNKKSKYGIRLGNTDPALIRKFLEFLLKILGVNRKKLRFGLQIFSDMSKKKVLQFWVKELKEFKVKKGQFFKIIVTPSNSIGTYRTKTKYGVLSIYFSNTKLKKIIDDMLPR